MQAPPTDPLYDASRSTLRPTTVDVKKVDLKYKVVNSVLWYDRLYQGVDPKPCSPTIHFRGLYKMGNTWQLSHCVIPSGNSEISTFWMMKHWSSPLISHTASGTSTKQL